jgi:regulator of protease activity HflC (stomatin/prohibitin superfamily)
MDQALGSLMFSLIVAGIIIGSWTWVLVLSKKGIMGLIGYNRVVVQPFESMLLYRNGILERALPQGRHLIRARNLQLVRIDMRPEVYRITQSAISSDHFAVNLLYVARAQIVDPRTALESTKNYRDEVVVRLQSVVKNVCSEKPRLEIQMNHEGFNDSAKRSANLSLRDLGCECLTFELLQADSAGAIADLDDKRMGFGPH